MLQEIVYLVTDNFTLVYKVQQLRLKDYRIIHQFSWEGIPPQSTVITNEKRKDGRYTLIHVNARHSPIRLKQLIISGIKNRDSKRIIVGIDPGLNTGIAILLHDTVIASTLVIGIRAGIQWIQNQLKALHPGMVVLRIGDGYKEKADEFLHAYYREFSELATVELVDESYTSVKRDNSLSIHEQAAVLIAQRQGELYSKEL